MEYQIQIDWMKALAGTFDSVGYAGIGRQTLIRCIAAFEVGDKDRALAEYRHAIGPAPNFASALSDLDAESFSSETHTSFLSHMMGVMGSMCLLMGGDVK